MHDGMLTSVIGLSKNVEVAQIALLIRGDSPRLNGENIEHIQLLAESQDKLPPVVVHRPTMRIIDGMHRLRAAQLRGQTEIEVIFFEGDEADAFVYGVQSNVAHGLPLSLRDRREAAGRILTTHSHWSNRRIAAIVGLAPSTVQAIRTRSTDRNDQMNTRVGRDGAARRLNASAGRVAAGKLIREKPEASVREIAALAGISPATVQDVRERLRAGRDVIPDRQRENPVPRQRSNSSPEPEPEPEPGKGSQAEARSDALFGAAPRVADEVQPFDGLVGDPSLRLNEFGWRLIRLLSVQAVIKRDSLRLAAAVPFHLRKSVIALARQTGDTWHEFARCLDSHNNS
jgi:ParB-like chromosome segregation protein Spo0J